MSGGKSTTWATNEEEICAYFWFYTFMGLVREPEIREYWSNDEIFLYSPVAGWISCHRLRRSQDTYTLWITSNSQPVEHVACSVSNLSLMPSRAGVPLFIPQMPTSVYMRLWRVSQNVYITNYWHTHCTYTQE